MMSAKTASCFLNTRITHQGLLACSAPLREAGGNPQEHRHEALSRVSFSGHYSAWI